MGYFVKNRALQSGSSGVVLPAGGSALRPVAPIFGLIRYNTDLAAVEFFNGTQFVQLSAAGAIDYTVDSFVGTGVQTVFTMSVQESLTTQIIVFVGSIYQDPTTAYTVNGGFDITFTSAPPDGEPISVIHTAVDATP
jgi:hypothetical protein